MEIVNSFESRILKDPLEWEATHDTYLDIKPYMDPVLQNDVQKYTDFICRLFEHGIVDFTDQPRERCTIFFVKRRTVSCV